MEHCFFNFYGKTDVQFDREQLRKHCIECLEQNEFTPFPKKKRCGKSTNKGNVSKRIAFFTQCFCGMPDFYENLVQCDDCAKCATSLVGDTITWIMTVNPIYVRNVQITQ